MDSLGKEADRKNEMEVRFYKKREEDEYVAPKEEEKPAEDNHDHTPLHDYDLESAAEINRLRPDSALSGMNTQEMIPIHIKPSNNKLEDSHDSDAEGEDDDHDDANSAINSQKNANANLLQKPPVQNQTEQIGQAQRPVPMTNNFAAPQKTESEEEDEDEEEEEDDEEEEKPLSPQKQAPEEDKEEVQIVGEEIKKTDQNFEDSEDEEDIDRNTKNNAVGNVQKVNNFTFDGF
mmetsp:Transcript_82769/g.96764  ORF Transcript_82769/g.96764 Transcript_82769/m.96764 type:complete len:233 (+) Transcript_82769:1-699(+)